MRKTNLPRLVEAGLQWVWHCHHDILLEPLTEPLKNRIAYIKKSKPENELKLRLKLLKLVKGKLPKRFIEAGKACNETWKAYVEAWKAYEKMIVRSKEINALHQKECGCSWNGKTILENKPM